MKTRIRSALVVGEGEDSSFAGYIKLHYQCEVCSRMTVENHKILIERWHQLLSLFREAL